MGRFGGARYGLHWRTKQPAGYIPSQKDLLRAWEAYQRGIRASKIVNAMVTHGFEGCSLRKLVVEWGALGLPVWEFGRRSKIRDATSRALERLQKKFDLPTTATMYAALKFAESQGAELRSILEQDFGQGPKRPKRWYQKVLENSNSSSNSSSSSNS
jgi:hypothetical protein